MVANQDPVSFSLLSLKKKMKAVCRQHPAQPHTMCCQLFTLRISSGGTAHTPARSLPPRCHTLAYGHAGRSVPTNQALSQSLTSLVGSCSRITEPSEKSLPHTRILSNTQAHTPSGQASVSSEHFRPGWMLKARSRLHQKMSPAL